MQCLLVLADVYQRGLVRSDAADTGVIEPMLMALSKLIHTARLGSRAGQRKATLHLGRRSSHRCSNCFMKDRLNRREHSEHQRQRYEGLPSKTNSIYFPTLQYALHFCQSSDGIELLDRRLVLFMDVKPLRIAFSDGRGCSCMFAIPNTTFHQFPIPARGSTLCQTTLSTKLRKR